jgi:hypothetical protein
VGNLDRIFDVRAERESPKRTAGLDKTRGIGDPAGRAVCPDNDVGAHAATIREREPSDRAIPFEPRILGARRDRFRAGVDRCPMKRCVERYSRHRNRMTRIGLALVAGERNLSARGPDDDHVIDSSRSWYVKA